MTVSTTANSVVYRGNGSATDFAVPFKVLDEDHLQVTRRDYDTGALDHTYIGTEYSFTGIGDVTGELTLAGTPLDSDYELVIERIVPYTQDLDIVNAGGFYPETVEEQLDLIVMGVQQLADLASRGISVPVGEDGLTLSKAEDRANMYFAFDADGNFVTSSGTGADAGLRADLAASGGTALVGFLDDASGAAATGLQTLLRGLLRTQNIWPTQPGEVGVLNLTYPVGDVRRYGIFPDGVTNWESSSSYISSLVQTMAAGYQSIWPKHGDDSHYHTSINLTNRYGTGPFRFKFEEGVSIGGIVHLISSGSPMALKTITAVGLGAVTTTITVGAGHSMTVGEQRYVTFRDTGMAALDGLSLLATPTSATQFTVPANTAAQVWGGGGIAEDTPIHVEFEGSPILYDRFGAIFCNPFYGDSVYLKSNTAKHTSGLQCRGAHIYFGCDNWSMNDIVVDDIGPQSQSPTNHAAIAIDGDNREPRKLSFRKLHVKDSQASGIIIKGAEVSAQSIVVEAYGRGVITVAPEGMSGADPDGNTPETRAYGVALVRASANVDHMHIDQKNGLGSRAFAKYGLLAEGTFISWASSASFSITRKGSHIGHLTVGDVKSSCVAVGAFGQAADLQIDRFDRGDVNLTNDQVTDASTRAASGQLWVVNGHLGVGRWTVGKLDLAHFLKTESAATASVKLRDGVVGTHKARAIYCRCPGDLGDIYIEDRTGGSSTVPSITVDGAQAINVTINRLRGRNPSGVAGGANSTDIPFILFAPSRGEIRDFDIQDYAPTPANSGAMKLGANGAERLRVLGGYLFKSGADAGNGLIFDGTVDTRINDVRVEGFAIGVNDQNANTRIHADGNIATGNTTDTSLPVAQAHGGVAGNNTTFFS